MARTMTDLLHTVRNKDCLSKVEVKTGHLEKSEKLRLFMEMTGII